MVLVELGEVKTVEAVNNVSLDQDLEVQAQVEVEWGQGDIYVVGVDLNEYRGTSHHARPYK